VNIGMPADESHTYLESIHESLLGDGVKTTGTPAVIT
jgi:hypothetical protein